MTDGLFVVKRALNKIAKHTGLSHAGKHAAARFLLSKIRPIDVMNEATF